MLKIYLISQSENQNHETYDSAVVVAKSARQAKLIHPGDLFHCGENKWNAEKQDWFFEDEPDGSGWCNPKHVNVHEIGIANYQQKEGEIICKSFNAG